MLPYVAYGFFVFYQKGDFMVKINGEQKDVEGMSILTYLQSENYNIQRVAIECNGNIIPKSQYETFILKENDSLEVVSFVGGG